MSDEPVDVVCAEPIKAPWRSLLRLLAMVRGEHRMLVLGFVLTIASAGAGLVAPYLTIPFVDDILLATQADGAIMVRRASPIIGGMIFFPIVAWLLGWARMYVFALLSERIGVSLRNMTFAHLHGLSLDIFNRYRTGDLIARVGDDTTHVCFFLANNLLDFCTDVIVLVMISVVLLSVSPGLALVAIVPAPLIFLLIQAARNRTIHGLRTSRIAWSELTSVLADTVSGVRVVKAFCQERREIERFRRVNHRVLTANNEANRSWALFLPLVSLLTEFGIVLIWIVGAWHVAHQHVTLGVLTGFVAYLSRFYSRLDAMSRMFPAMQLAGISAQRVLELLACKTTVAEAERPVPIGRVRGEIELSCVSFRYDSREVLRDISLRIEPGEMVGLVGPSGAGKTTLVNLVSRFFDPDAGVVRVDGTDIRLFPLEAYRRSIGIVLQEPLLFHGNIAENIAYARPDAPMGDIVAAAKAAGVDDFISRLPDGYRSQVGERGQLLSGGERQRISIARALLIDPPILILDEATSSVDAETDRAIQLAIETLTRGRTTIVIAHRLCTLRRVDRLIVVEDGRITAVGSHGNLLKTSNTYARLYEAQWSETWHSRQHQV
jgi:ATP-binding cassette subfamily B protein